MSERKGDWRDLLSAYHLALKGNKIWSGFLTLLYLLLAMVAASILYSMFVDWKLIEAIPRTQGLVGLGRVGESGSLVWLIAEGRGLEIIPRFLPLLNPVYGASWGHMVISVLFYLMFFWAVTGNGGVISRLTALEYARQDFPTLGDARAMVRSKRKAYFLTPLWPFLFVVVPLIGCALIGLFCSIPYVGRVLMVPLYALVLVLGVVALLFAGGWVLGFGMMMPALSVGGKDAFDAWSTPYAYVLWQFGRYVLYTLLLGAIGVLAAFAAHWVVELFIWLIYQGTELGFISSIPWMDYEGIDLGWVSIAGLVRLPYNAAGYVSAVTDQGALARVVSTILAIITLLVKALPVAYVISYFFTGNTVMFFLLRKHVDNIDIEEIYEEAEEEEGFPLEEEVGEELAEEEPVTEEVPVEAEAPAEEPAEEAPAEEAEEPEEQPAEEEEPEETEEEAEQEKPEEGEEEQQKEE